MTELQNQDPTSPVDPTAMVGQMVSLNQLDQLIAINQTLDNMSSGTSGTTGTAQCLDCCPDGCGGSRKHDPGCILGQPAFDGRNRAQSTATGIHPHHRPECAHESIWKLWDSSSDCKFNTHRR